MTDLTKIMPRRRGAREKVEGLLALADVRVGGTRPWDLQVHDSRLYSRLLAGGSLTLGESYMDGWWDAPAPDQLIHRLIEADLSKKVRPLAALLPVLRAKLFNLQTKSGATKVAREHYALSPELYMSFLDPYNQYTCGYFEDTDDLNTAQEQKLDLVCRKLGLSSRDTVLDIGCGWGGFARFAAERYGAHVTGVTNSGEQAEYARAFCSGLPVEIIESDYRDVRGAFDKALVCGMIEHVGQKNYRTLMKVVRRRAEGRRLVLAPHNRKEHLQQFGRPMDREVHLPQLDAPIGQADSQGHGGRAGARGLARLRRPLRQDPHGLAPQLRRQLGQDQGRLRRTVPAHVGVLSSQLRGGVPVDPDQALASCLLQERRAGRLSVRSGEWAIR